MQLPIGEEADLRGVVELLNDSAVTYSDEAPRGTEGAVPAEMEMEEHEIHDALIEGIVVGDDELMERYLGDEKIEIDELAHALADGIASASVFPVLCGSATRLIGVDRLAKFLVEEAPAPSTNNGQTAVQVFKTIVDPYVGHVNLFKVLGGSVKHDEVLVNARTHADERLHQLFTMRGKEQDAVDGGRGRRHRRGRQAQRPRDRRRARDQGRERRRSRRSRSPNRCSRWRSTPSPRPTRTSSPTRCTGCRRKTRCSGSSATPRRTRRCSAAWARPTSPSRSRRLARKFGVEVESEEVRVAYRETIGGEAEAEGKVKKQSGGHGQFAVAWLRVEPTERGSGVEFVDKIVGGVIPRQYIPAVEKGVTETAESGGALGFPIVDVRVTCFDGKAHSVDSSEMAFKTAAAHGLKDALAKAGPVLLEPVSELVVTVPEANQGDIMGDLNGKRGRIQGSASVGNGEVEIVATVPTSEVLRYAIDLRSMTGGRGRFTARHSHYDPVPAHLVDKITTGA